MNNFSPDTTVGEIARLAPLSVWIFEDHKIDFCCGGRMALSDACRAKGLDPAAILEAIERTARRAGAPPASTDWSAAPLSILIDHILTTHHQYMKAQLPRLDAMREKIVTKHGPNYPEVLSVSEIFRSMKEELEAHLMKEEMILFPLIRSFENGDSPAGRRAHCGSVQNPIRVMFLEHDSAGDALARLRELTKEYTPPGEACNTFRAFYAGLADMERDLHQHIHLENNILFPRAVELEAAVSQTA